MSDSGEIRTVLARIAQTADTATDLADNLALYTPDAVWAFGDVLVEGREALRAAAQARRDAGRAGPGTASRHLVGTIAVSVDGDTAVAESYWQFFTSTTTAPTLDSMGAYRDTLVRGAEGWQVARREITSG